MNPEDRAEWKPFLRVRKRDGEWRVSLFSPTMGGCWLPLPLPQVVEGSTTFADVLSFLRLVKS